MSLPKSPTGACCWTHGASVVFCQPLCLRGLNLHLSLLGLGLIHLPPVGPLKEATLGEEEEEEEGREGCTGVRLEAQRGSVIVAESKLWPRPEATAGLMWRNCTLRNADSDEQTHLPED